MAGTAPADDRTKPAPERIERLHLAGAENVFRLTDDLLTGSEPVGEAGFDALALLGVRTIVSVDGAAPEVATARRHGLRYVHLPMGYDGLAPAERARLVRAVGALPGPVYLHCHHGKHRGPAAAAYAMVCLSGWSRAAAHAWMLEAGTSPRYASLYALVDSGEPPTTAALAAIDVGQLPEQAPVPPLVERMLAIDRTWEPLKKRYEASEKGQPLAPDRATAAETLLLREQFQELARQDRAPEGADPTRATDFRQHVANALEASRTLAEVFQPPSSGQGVDAATRSSAMKRVAQSCSDCHAVHRDQ